MSAVHIRVVKPGELSQREIESWRELRAASGAPANPFMEPDFTLAVGRVRPGARVAVLRQDGLRQDGLGQDGPRQDGEAIGFFPYEKGLLGQGRAIGFGVSDSQGAVLRPEAGIDVRDLLRGCGLSAWEFDNLEAGQGLFLPSAAEECASYVIDVRQGPEQYLELLRKQSPKFLKTTLAKERRMGRQIGEPRFVLDERDPAALERLMAWKSAQYRRTGRGDRFAKDWISGLVRYLAYLREPGCSGLLSVLYAGDRPVAAHFGLRSRTVLSCWFPAYEPEFAKYSPGLILHLRMAEGAAGAGIGMLDMGRGAAEYKDALKTGELPVYEGASRRPGAGAALHWAGREPSRRAHSFVRSRPGLAAFAQRSLERAGRLRAK